MKIILDTNVVLDYLLSREPFNVSADTIFDLIGDNDIWACINSSSVTDIYYILNKKYGDTESRNMVRAMLRILEAVEVTHDDCLTALDSPMPDFEDALVTVCADKVDIDYIVTRDDEFLKIPKAISPVDFLKKTSR